MFYLKINNTIRMFPLHVSPIILQHEQMTPKTENWRINVFISLLKHSR